MAKVLYTWEFGGGLGHLLTALPLANAYREQGHEVIFTVKDVVSAGFVIPSEIYPVIQAPIWNHAPDVRLSPPISYAEILLNHGFSDAGKLISMVRAWITLFRLIRPDLIVLDFSPTAMFAAKLAGIRHCTIGMGFFLPPRLSPVPAFMPNVDPARLSHSESLLLQALNRVRGQFGRSDLDCFADFFDTDLDMLTTWPELEHYPQRQNAEYLGPVLLRHGGKIPDWPNLNKKRIFVYLYGHFSGLDNLLQAIISSGAEVLLYCPGLSEELKTRFQRAHILFSNELYAFDQVLQSADLLICHGNFGTVWEGMLAGVPMLCLPAHIEQYVATLRLVEQGVGILMQKHASQEALLQGINHLLSCEEYKRNAQRIAQKYRQQNSSRQLAKLVDLSTGIIK